MKRNIHKRILIAVDGSEQALNAVRYIAMMAVPDSTDVVLFNVGGEYPEVFWDMDNNPLYRSKRKRVMGWLADSQLVMGEFKEKAFKVLSDAGIPESAVTVKIQPKKTNVLKDIIQESYQDYNAITVGRTGVSRFKDLIFGSLAQKLAEKVKHIPTIIVGGRPKSRDILVALDTTIEAMRGVSHAGALAGTSDHKVILCHCLNQSAIALPKADRQPGTESELDWVEYHKNRFRPVMEEACQRLQKTGVLPDRISQEFVIAKGDIVGKLIEIGRSGRFGTIVVGRREEPSFYQLHFKKRVGNRIIDSLEDMAVWVIS